jgi:membrane protein implicated in regulation of membrane protease activity
MSDISNAVCSAIDVLTDVKISKLRYDKTVQAEIYSIVNLDEGEYKVKYSGNVFSAFANDLTKQYSVGDNVYVIVPEGDFSNRKKITGLITDSSLSYS